MDREDAPTALFCTKKRITLGAYLAVQRPGTDAWLAGFGMADMLKVPVTVIAYDADEVGRRATQLLLDRIDRSPDTPPGPARRTVVPTSVVRYGA
ncbi:substrate-binding domain-containing protein [Streptomyces sp. NPDC055134]